MNELELARAIRDGTLPSPQKCGDNLWLFAVRITGTGVAFRAKHDEFVLRDPSLYLNGDFLERCQGLPVIIEHPETGKLDTREFTNRVVGAIMLPYVRDSEVWGIARIYDQQAADAMQRWQLSTSPSVMLRKSDNQEAGLKDKSFLIEGEPYLLDHLAICTEGVWDKGGGPSGVAVERNDTMSDAEKNDTPMDKLLEHLEGIERRVTDCIKRTDAMSKRMDAKEKSEKQSEEEPGAKPLVADSDEETDPRYHIRMADAQARADDAYSAWGERAPKPLSGERLSDYRKRLLRSHLRHSEKFKASDLELVTDPHIFAAVEQTVYSDSVAAATKPESIGPGRLRMVTSRLESGHTVNTFHGDPQAWMNYFAGNKKLVRRIDPKPPRDLSY